MSTMIFKQKPENWERVLKWNLYAKGGITGRKKRMYKAREAWSNKGIEHLTWKRFVVKRGGKEAGVIVGQDINGLSISDAWNRILSKAVVSHEGYLVCLGTEL